MVVRVAQTGTDPRPVKRQVTERVGGGETWTGLAVAGLDDHLPVSSGIAAAGRECRDQVRARLERLRAHGDRPAAARRGRPAAGG